MKLKKSKLAFAISVSLILGVMLFVLHVMDVGGFLMIPTNVEALVSVEKIYYACVLFILLIGYFLANYVIRYFTLPTELIVDFQNRVVKDINGKVLTRQFIKLKAVSFSPSHHRFLMDFYGLERRIYLIQLMYKSELSIQEMIAQHAQDGAMYMNPFRYFNKGV